MDRLPKDSTSNRGNIKPIHKDIAPVGEGQAGQVKPVNVKNVVRPPAPGGSGGKGK